MNYNLRNHKYQFFGRSAITTEHKKNDNKFSLQASCMKFMGVIAQVSLFVALVQQNNLSAISRGSNSVFYATLVMLIFALALFISLSLSLSALILYTRHEWEMGDNALYLWILKNRVPSAARWKMCQKQCAGAKKMGIRNLFGAPRGWMNINLFPATPNANGNVHALFPFG